MKTYTEEQVIKALEHQRYLTAFTLGYSSKPYVYPHDFGEMFEWMMKTPIVMPETTPQPPQTEQHVHPNEQKD